MDENGVLCMLINLDKYLVKELQERGFDVDYKKMVEIYKASRQQPGCIARKKRKAQEEALFAEIEKRVLEAQQAKK